MKFSEKTLRDRLSKRVKTLKKVRVRAEKCSTDLTRIQLKWQKAHEDATAPQREAILAAQKLMQADGEIKQKKLQEEQGPILEEGQKLSKEIPRLEAQIAELKELLGEEDPEEDSDESEPTSNVTELPVKKTDDEGLSEDPEVDYSVDAEEEDEDDSDLDAILSRT